MKKVNSRVKALACLAVLITIAATIVNTNSSTHAQKIKVFSGPKDAHVPGRILVKFNDHVLPAHARNIIAALGARDADEIPNTGVHILDLPYQASEKAFVQTFQAQPEVEFAELDQIVAPADVMPNDPLYPSSDQWHLRKISAPTGWSISTGSSSVVIAILDTGVDATHPDLAAQIVSGWNVYDNNGNFSDVHGHGTQVAGTAAAATDNSLGVASVAWGCKLMPIRISALNGTATYSTMANGLTWAADHGARIANISYIASDSSTVKTAAQYFQNRGGVVVAAAGNSATFSSNPDNPYILTVSATDQADVLSYWSNYGNNVDLAAPEGAGTTLRGGGYVYAGGTSIASPIVAGAAALVMSTNPMLTPVQIQDVLKQNADDLGAPGWDTSYGNGRLNVARALTAAGGRSTSDTAPPTVSFNSPIKGETISGTVAIAISASDNVSVASVELSIDGVLLGANTGSPFSFSWNTATLPNGYHSLTATARDAAANTSTASVSVLINNVADTTPPNVSINSPANGATIAGNVSVSVTASDNAGPVTKVELYVDGKLKGSATTAPFTIKWNTRKEAAGMHTLYCRAFDAAGNTGASQQLSVYK